LPATQPSRRASRSHVQSPRPSMRLVPLIARQLHRPCRRRTTPRRRRAAALRSARRRPVRGNSPCPMTSTRRSYTAFRRQPRLACSRSPASSQRRRSAAL
jgi:hypothetical protein